MGFMDWLHGAMPWFSHALGLCACHMQVVGLRNVMMMDEISTGLDSATLFTVINWFSKVGLWGEEDASGGAVQLSLS